MNMRPTLVFLTLSATLALTAAHAQQRVDFERKKFDRSRFDRPGQTTAAPATAPTAAPLAPATASFATPSNPPPMPTEQSTAVSSTSDSTNTSIFSADSTLPSRPPAGATPYYTGITPEEKAVIDAPLFDQLPTKDFNNAKDHEDLLALQKKTGACMIVYFKNPSVSNEKGLCSWYEKTVTTDIKWRKAMKYYLRLEIILPGNSLVQDLATRYRANKTPAVLVVKPGSTMPTRLKLFDYPNGSRPVPIGAETVLESLKAASTPAYQTLF